MPSRRPWLAALAFLGFRRRPPQVSPSTGAFSDRVIQEAFLSGDMVIGNLNADGSSAITHYPLPSLASPANPDPASAPGEE